MILWLQRQRVISGSLIGRAVFEEEEVLMPYYAGRDEFSAERKVVS